MALGQFCAGPYSAVYNSVALGLLVGDTQAPDTQIIPHGQVVTNSHLWGRNVLDVIMQGGEAFANLILMEYSPTIMAAIWPWMGVSGNTLSWNFPTIGSSLYDVAQALVFTAQGGLNVTTAGIGPVVRTCHKAVLREEFAKRLSMGPLLRETPLQFRLFQSSTSLNKPWTDSAS